MPPPKDCRPTLSSMGPLRLDGVGSLECARENSSGERVYLRIVPDGFRVDEVVGRAQLLSEAPGLPKVLDAGSWQGEVWVTCQFPEGNLLSENDRWNDVEVTRHGARLAQALLTLHDAGLVHGALSQDAVLIDNRGEAWLHDAPLLELNRITDRRPEETQAALWVRHARYVAPEVLSGGPATPSSDVYALGVLLMLQSGALGPSARSPLEVLHQRMTGAWTPEPAPRLKPSLQNCLRLMVSIDPLHRLTAAEVVKQLSMPAVLDAVTDPHQVFPGPRVSPLPRPPGDDLQEVAHTSPQWKANAAVATGLGASLGLESLAIEPPPPAVVPSDPRPTTPSIPKWSAPKPVVPAPLVADVLSDTRVDVVSEETNVDAVPSETTVAVVPPPRTSPAPAPRASPVMPSPRASPQRPRAADEGGTGAAAMPTAPVLPPPRASPLRPRSAEEGARAAPAMPTAPVAPPPRASPLRPRPTEGAGTSGLGIPPAPVVPPPRASPMRPPPREGGGGSGAAMSPALLVPPPRASPLRPRPPEAGGLSGAAMPPAPVVPPPRASPLRPPPAAGAGVSGATMPGPRASPARPLPTAVAMERGRMSSAEAIPPPRASPQRPPVAAAVESGARELELGPVLAETAGASRPDETASMAPSPELLAAAGAEGSGAAQNAAPTAPRPRTPSFASLLAAARPPPAEVQALSVTLPMEDRPIAAPPPAAPVAEVSPPAPQGLAAAVAPAAPLVEAALPGSLPAPAHPVRHGPVPVDEASTRATFSAGPLVERAAESTEVTFTPMPGPAPGAKALPAIPAAPEAATGATPSTASAAAAADIEAPFFAAPDAPLSANPRDEEDDEATVAMGPHEDPPEDPSAFELRHPVLAAAKRSPAKAGAVAMGVVLLLGVVVWLLFSNGSDVREVPVPVDVPTPVAPVAKPAPAPEPVAPVPAPEAAPEPVVAAPVPAPAPAPVLKPEPKPKPGRPVHAPKTKKGKTGLVAPAPAAAESPRSKSTDAPAAQHEPTPAPAPTDSDLKRPKDPDLKRPRF